MLYVALLAAAAALFWAWRCSRSVRDLRARNDRLSSQLYDLRLRLHRTNEAHEQSVAQLTYELLRQAGDLKVTGDMTIEEITATHPHAAAVLAGYHIGGCASCAVDGALSLNEAVVTNGGQLEPLLVALNTLVVEGSDGMVPEEELRTPNVQLSL
jgi:hypothetical protein